MVLLSELATTQRFDDERRRHSRVRVAISGRYMLENRQEFTCTTINMSPGGVLLRAPVAGKVTERVVAYLEHFGRIEGIIVRTISDGFALKMSLPASKRDRVADLLTWLANRSSVGMTEDRRHDRIVPHNPETILQIVSGGAAPARIIDISVSGVAVAIDKRPVMGTRVIVGNTPGKVVRHFDDGIGVEFLRLVPSETFDEDIVL